MDLTKQARRTLWICAALSAVTLAVYWPVTGHDFISCDDPAYVVLNAHVLTGLTWDNIAWAFSTSFQANWHPVTWLSHMLDVQLFGVRPGWHHFVSLLFHVANGVLLFLLLQRLTGAAWRSAAVAALFALHPLHVESVAWVAERKDVLSGFFFMLTLWAYARYAQVQSLESRVPSRESAISDQSSVISGDQTTDHGPRTTELATPLTRDASRASLFYVLALLCFALGLMSKPMLVTVPFVLLLLDYWPLGRLRISLHAPRPTPLRPLLREKLPFFALAAVSCMATFLAQSQAGAVSSLARVSLEQRGANALVAYATYLSQTFWPSGLAIFYPLRGQLPTATVAAAAVVLLVITVWALRHIRRDPHLAVGWFWFVGMLVPVIGLVQVGTQQRADRYTYLPLIGFFIMLVWEAAAICRWRQTRDSKSETQNVQEAAALEPQVCQPQKPGFGAVACGVVAGLVLAVCAVLTYRQVGWWRNTERLFQHALNVTQGNYMAHNNLAGDFLLRGDLDQAIAHYQASLALQPSQPQQIQIRYYLGQALSQRGRHAEAADQFSAVLQNRPQDAGTLVQLGIARARQGKPEEAERALTEALRLAPGDPAAHNSFGNVLAQQDRHEEAVRQFEEALRLNPDYPAARNNLAISCTKLGRVSEAVTQYREALRVQPNAIEALNNLAWILAAHPDGRYRNGTEAVELATRTCELTRYQSPIPLITLAAAYGEIGKFREAASLAEQAQGLMAGSNSPLSGRLRAMLEAFHAGKPYHGE